MRERERAVFTELGGTNNDCRLESGHGNYSVSKALFTNKITASNTVKKIKDLCLNKKR